MRLSIIAASAAVLGLAAAGPAMAADTMMSGKPSAMHSNMMAGGMAGSSGGRLVEITLEDLTTGQPFSPSFFETHAKDGAPLFKLGDKAPDALVPVAEGGDIGMFSVGAAKALGQAVGDAALAIHTLPGQTRTLFIHVDKEHPIIDGAWMLGNTNDGFSGITGVDAYALKKPMTLEVRGYDAGSEKNNEKKGYLPALGGGNMRDPEDGVITYHTGIRGDADAPAAWNWDVSKPVARITITPVGH